MDECNSRAKMSGENKDIWSAKAKVLMAYQQVSPHEGALPDTPELWTQVSRVLEETRRKTPPSFWAQFVLAVATLILSVDDNYAIFGRISSC